VQRFVVGLCLCLLIAASAVMLALPTPSQFELEGNAVVDSAPADDWANTVPPPPSATSEALASVFVADGSGNATIFTTGGSKDVNDISQWQWKDEAGGLPLLVAVSALRRVKPAGAAHVTQNTSEYFDRHLSCAPKRKKEAEAEGDGLFGSQH
jgi:hypothetical protein